MSPEATLTEQPQSEVVESTEAAPVVEAAPVEKPAFDPSNIPAEVQDHYKKQYGDYESLKQQAQQWEGVRNDQRFQQWAQGLNAPQTPKPFEITDDQFASALTDKAQFLNLVNQAAEQLVNQKVGPQLQQTQYQIEFSRANAEIAQMKAKYPDFDELDKRNMIAPYVQKYRGISFEDAYWLAKKGTFNEEVDKRARGVVASKKGASVERPGTPPGARTNKVKVGTRLEAMELAAEAFRAGKEPPEFEIGDDE